MERMRRSSRPSLARSYDIIESRFRKQLSYRNNIYFNPQNQLKVFLRDEAILGEPATIDPPVEGEIFNPFNEPERL
jgi:hypothetical protein